MVKNQKLKGKRLLDPKIKVASVCQIMITKSVQCAWVKRMKEGIGKEWMEIPSFYHRNVGGSFIFDCDYNLYLLNLATCLLSILIFSKRGLKSRGYAKLISTKITLEVVSCGIESFSTNEESDYEHEIWKKVVKSMRKVSNLVRRTRRRTSLK